jgi:hypothetical protein
MIAQGDADNIAMNNLTANKDKNALIALKALIEGRLAALDAVPVVEEVIVTPEVEKETNGDKDTEMSG